MAGRAVDIFRRLQDPPEGGPLAVAAGCHRLASIRTKLFVSLVIYISTTERSPMGQIDRKEDTRGTWDGSKV
jgi:hypothetical protein